MTIRERVPNFRTRDSDTPILGRNKTRIILGTDRKNTVDSGFGDDSERASSDAGAIDIVVGYNSENSDFINDKVRIYLSSKTNPDEYAEMDVGEPQQETPSAVVIADQVYIKARKNIKIRNGEITIVLSPDGNISIEASGNTRIKSGASVMNMGAGGDINIGAEGGQPLRVITELDICVGVDPTTGSPILSQFATGPGADHPLGGVVQNQNVKIVK